MTGEFIVLFQTTTMNKCDIINFAKKNGLKAINKSFNNIPTLFIGKGEYNDPVVGSVYKDGIFIYQKNDKWIIGFSQSAKTRKLSHEELMTAILEWKDGKSLKIYEQNRTS